MRATTDASRIKQARQLAGLTQAALAARSGVDQPALSRIEGGHRRPSLTVLQQLARAMGVTTSALLGEGGQGGSMTAAPGGLARIASKIASDHATPAGLLALAQDAELSAAFGIAADEFRLLQAIPVKGVSKQGYLELLVTVRVVARG